MQCGLYREKEALVQSEPDQMVMGVWVDTGWDYIPLDRFGV